MRNRIASAALTGVLLAAVSGPAFAADGQIAINMARVMAGNVTPGDAPGFPVTISQPGSYILTGNLTVPNANTTAISIAASHVTLDLNGFSILGPTDCSGGFFPCAGAGSGTGVTTDDVRFNITVRNGTIQGMGALGILLSGDSHLVEYVHLRSNGDRGIEIEPSDDAGSSTVQYATVQRNGELGILLRRGAVRNSTVDVNASGGIEVEVGTVSNNVVARNFVGIVLGAGASAFGNTMSDNPAGNFRGLASQNQGQNFCSGAGGGC